MNIKEIKEMIQLMNENGLAELEMEEDGIKIRLKKGPSGMIEQSQEVRYVQAVPASSSAEGGSLPAGQAGASGGKPAAVRSIIKSPMVGTFYSAPAPDAPPFVQAGSQIEIGQVICIIEAMKLMNEIKAEVRGKISEILVNNGDPVEFGQPLFTLE